MGTGVIYLSLHDVMASVVNSFESRISWKANLWPYQSLIKLIKVENPT